MSRIFIAIIIMAVVFILKYASWLIPEVLIMTLCIYLFTSTTADIIVKLSLYVRLSLWLLIFLYIFLYHNYSGPLTSTDSQVSSATMSSFSQCPLRDTKNSIIIHHSLMATILRAVCCIHFFLSNINYKFILGH